MLRNYSSKPYDFIYLLTFHMIYRKIFKFLKFWMNVHRQQKSGRCCKRFVKPVLLSAAPLMASDCPQDRERWQGQRTKNTPQILSTSPFALVQNSHETPRHLPISGLPVS